MKRPRVRIATLMYLVIIAALTTALIVEKRRSAALLAEAQAGSKARQQAQYYEYFEQLSTARVPQKPADAKGSN